MSYYTIIILEGWISPLPPSSEIIENELCQLSEGSDFQTLINTSQWNYWKIIWFMLYLNEGTNVEATKTSEEVILIYLNMLCKDWFIN